MISCAVSGKVKCLQKLYNTSKNIKYALLSIVTLVILLSMTSSASAMTQTNVTDSGYDIYWNPVSCDQHDFVGYTILLDGVSVGGSSGTNTYKHITATVSQPQLITITASIAHYTTVWSSQYNNFVPKYVSTETLGTIESAWLQTLQPLLVVPSSLAASNITSSSFNVSWDSQPNVNYYNIYNNGELIDTATSPFYNFQALPGTQYSITVTASNNSGETAQSQSIVVTTTLPLLETPASLTASDITSSSFNIAWEPQTNATSYSIYSNSTLIDTTTSPFYTLQGLDAATQYSIVVEVSNDYVASKQSQPLKVVTLQPLLVAPSSLTESNITDSSFKVSWDSQTDATSYTIYNNGIVVDTTISTSYIFQNLDPQTQCQITVSASNNSGESEQSQPIVVTTLNSEAKQPKNLQADSINDTSFNLTFDLNSEIVDGYNIYIDGIPYGSTITSAPQLISGLQPKTSYSITLTAINSVGESITSLPLTVVTLQPLLVAPSNLTASNITDSSFKVSWDSQTDANSYTIYNNGIVVDTTTSTSTSYIFQNLDPQTQCQITVSASNNSGESEQSQPIVVTTLNSEAQQPKNLQADSITDTSFNLTFDLNSDTVDGYNIYIDGIPYGSTITSAPQLISGLQPKTSYSITLTALNSAGESITSLPLTVTTDSVAQPPLNLQANMIKDTSFNLTFNLNQASENVTSYKIYINSEIYGSPINSSPQLISGLTPDTTYSISLVASNTIGDSAQSEPITVTTISIPSTPQNLQVSDGTWKSATLYWDQSSGATTYNIYKNNSLIGTTSLSYYSVNSLAPATMYSFTVSAVNLAGESIQSLPVTIQTNIAPNANNTPSDDDIDQSVILCNPEGTKYYDVSTKTIKDLPSSVSVIKNQSEFTTNIPNKFLMIFQ